MYISYRNYVFKFLILIEFDVVAQNLFENSAHSLNFAGKIVKPWNNMLQPWQMYIERSLFFFLIWTHWRKDVDSNHVWVLQTHDVKWRFGTITNMEDFGGDRQIRQYLPRKSRTTSSACCRWSLAIMSHLERWHCLRYSQSRFKRARTMRRITMRYKLPIRVQLEPRSTIQTSWT